MAMKQLPDGVEVYSQSPDMTEASIPPSLLSSHTTKAGTWGRIVVLEGRLNYWIDGDDEVYVLSSDAPGIIEPEALHRVEPDGPVTFKVEFLR